METIAADTGAGIFLSDPQGTITAFRGGSDVRRLTERVFPTFGGTMSEDVAGTNAEGTAIEEGGTVQIWGEEHFVESLQGSCCTSVPIHDPIRRSVRGILSLALPAAVGMDMDPSFVAMITKGAAAEVTRLLSEKLSVREKSLLDTYLAEVRKRGGESVVVMDGRTAIATRSALEMLQPSDYAVLAGYAMESKQLSRSLEREILLDSDRRLHLRASPISSAGETIGSVIRLSAAAPARMTPQTRRGDSRTDPFTDIVGGSLSLRRALDVAQTAVRRQLPAYIVGDAGTGKQRLARAMAALMAAEQRILDCHNDSEVAIAGDLLSAVGEDVAVVLTHADKLTPAARAVVLDVLNSRENLPVIMTVGTLDADTMELTRALNGLEVEMPTLRHRRDDIPALVNHFVHEGPHAVGISRALMRALTEADWHENIAQLRDFVLSASARCGSGELGIEHLDEAHRRALSRARLSRLEEVELHQIRAALAEANGNRLQAAKLLEIGRSTLYRKIESYTRRGFQLGD
ncbi:helix-turn-helix domain-containing protein [Mycolicibacterium sp. P9-22]|uniref:helix-turn-helix domain-containing protein n=1 Tax=Mycolicibacterium sp. P9-22 TaxID=2024613 RepID=UPI001883CF5C|nr:helix-turn-helix domain-containing protein [Mycolicibacterium sp. P9-22]